MKTCSCCGHVLGNPYYQVTLTESRFTHVMNAGIRLSASAFSANRAGKTRGVESIRPIRRVNRSYACAEKYFRFQYGDDDWAVEYGRVEAAILEEFPELSI